MEFNLNASYSEPALEYLHRAINFPEHNRSAITYAIAVFIFSQTNCPSKSTKTESNLWARDP